MRKELLTNPLLLLSRIGGIAFQKYRLKKLKNSCGKNLEFDHISSLELLENILLFLIAFMTEHGFGLLALSSDTPLGKQLYQTDLLFYNKAFKYKTILT